MCGGKSPRGPSAEEIAAREALAADKARALAEKEAADNAKKKNDELLAGKASAAEAENVARSRQQSLLGALKEDEYKKKSKSTLLGGM